MGGIAVKKTKGELTKIKGVGEILTKRLIKAGYHSFDKIAAAGEEGLKEINGIKSQLIPSIIEQATALAAEHKTERARKVAEIKTAIAGIREQVERIATAVKKRAGQEAQGKEKYKIETQLRKMFTALENVEESLGKRVKGAQKKLSNAGACLATLSTETCVKRMGNRLKKARKSLKKIYE